MPFERLVAKTPDKPLLPNVHIEGTSHPHEEARLQKEIERRFVQQDHPSLQEIEAAERSKTKEEVVIIDFVNRASNTLIERYGGQAINIAPDQVHVLDKKRVPKNFEKLHGSFETSSYGTVVKEQPGKYPFAAATFHEMLHAKSRISYKPNKNEVAPVLKRKRIGLQLEDKNGRSSRFRWMNEAVTEELTIKFVRACIELKKWGDEIEATKDFLFQNEVDSDVQKDIYFAQPEKRGWFGKKKTEATLEEYSYRTERKALHVLVDFIYELNKGNFKSRQEVFDVFARAMISGTLLPLGRLIDRTFETLGTKSFRDLGSLDNKDDLQALIKKLETLLLRKQTMGHL